MAAEQGEHVLQRSGLVQPALGGGHAGFGRHGVVVVRMDTEPGVVVGSGRCPGRPEHCGRPASHLHGRLGLAVDEHQVPPYVGSGGHGPLRGGYSGLHIGAFPEGYLHQIIVVGVIRQGANVGVTNQQTGGVGTDRETGEPIEGRVGTQPGGDAFHAEPFPLDDQAVV